MNDLSFAAQEPLLIGINGLKYSGKSTTARFLEVTYRFKETAFADPIKRGLAAMFGVDISIFYDPELKDIRLPSLFGQSPRHLMQTLGTDWGRNMISKSLWIDLCLQRVHALRMAGRPLVVVSDVRRDNEAEAVIASGGVVWQVVRVDSGTQDNHESEEGIDPRYVSEVLVNDGPLHGLYVQIGDAIERLRSDREKTLRALPTV